MLPAEPAALVGIPPMSQYDAAATPMWRSFNNKLNTTAFSAIVPSINLLDKNTAMNEWQKRSEKFDLTKEDAVPDLEFNEVLWYGLKGDNIPFPGPKRAAFYKASKKVDKD